MRATFPDFYGVLNDFFPDSQKDAPLSCWFNSDQSVKHLIEAMGVPHTKAGCVLINDSPVDFSYRVKMTASGWKYLPARR